MCEQMSALVSVIAYTSYEDHFANHIAFILKIKAYIHFDKECVNTFDSAQDRKYSLHRKTIYN